MDKDGATAAREARARVVIELDYKVIQMIRAPQAIGAVGYRQFHRSIVVAVGGILAPAVVGADLPYRKESRGPQPAIRSPPEPQEPKAPARGGAVAFELVRANATAAERDRNRMRP